MKKLLEILEEIKPGVDFKNSKNMIEGGLIDSFDIITIITAINSEFDIDFTVADIMPENFETVETLYNTIERIKNK